MSIVGGVGEIGLFGRMEILNVGDGDTKLSFDPKNDSERKRAAKIVTEMLRLGFAVMVEVEVAGEKLFRRVHSFLEDTCEYVIFGDSNEAIEQEAAPGTGEAGTQRRVRKARPVRVPAERARAVGIARSAGG